MNPSTFFIFFALIMYLNNVLVNAAVYDASASKQWTAYYDTYKPSIVTIKDRVLHVGLHNNAINVTSIDGAVINVCNFTLPPDKIVKPKIVRPVTLGNGKIVVRTLMFQHATTYQSPSDSPVWDLFIIVDPFDCTSAKTIELYNKGWKHDISAVVPYHDSFDIFYRKSSSPKNDTSSEVFKTPRRFNDRAEPMKLDHYLGLETEILGFDIKTVKPYDASEGYICTLLGPKADNTMLLKRLDSRFQLVKETRVEAWANAMSVGDDSVSLCYITANKKPQSLGAKTNLDVHVTCSIFDTKDLTCRAMVRLYQPEMTSEKILKPEVVKVVSLDDDTTVTAIAFKHSGMSEDKGYTTDYYLQGINADGTTVKVVHVGTYTNFFDLMSLVSLGGGEVCLVVVGEIEPHFGYKNTRIQVISKCFNMLK